MKGRFELFTILVSELSRSIRKIKTEEMVGFNLKSPHVSCLYYIYKSGSLTATELCEICAEDKASVSRSLDFLEANGYILCNSTAKKRYKALLYLTEKGAEAGKYIADKIDSILDEASIGLTEEDRIIMYKSLSLINKNLKEICKKYGE